MPKIRKLFRDKPLLTRLLRSEAGDTPETSPRSRPLQTLANWSTAVFALFFLPFVAFGQGFNTGGSVTTINTIRDAIYCNDTSVSANTITCNTATTFTTYQDGDAIDLKVANTNSGATTIAINGLAAKAVTYNGTTPLIAGILVAGHTYRLQYDGTRFVKQEDVSAAGGSPGGPDRSLQIDNAGVFGGVATSYVRTDGSLEVGPWMSVPFGGFGAFQNLLADSDCFDCGTWTATNVTIADVGMTLPSGLTATNGNLDNDLTSTVANGSVEQCYDTGSGVGTRTFGLSVFLKVPTTPVTSRLIIHSDTPTTAVSQTVGVTTTWRRYFVSGTFGVDAGHQVCAQIVPVDGGTGLVYAQTAQLEESTATLPDIPSVPTPTHFGTNIPTRALGVNLDSFAGPANTPSGISFGYGNTSNISGGSVYLMFGAQNAITSNGGAPIAIGSGNTVSGSAVIAIGNGVTASGAAAAIIGTGSGTNDVANSLCLVASGGTASTGGCGLLLPPGDFTHPGGAQFGIVAFANLPASGGATVFGCSNCTVTSGADNTCADDSSGATPPTVHAVAKRINGAWTCEI